MTSTFISRKTISLFLIVSVLAATLPIVIKPPSAKAECAGSTVSDLNEIKARAEQQTGQAFNSQAWIDKLYQQKPSGSKTANPINLLDPDIDRQIIDQTGKLNRELQTLQQEMDNYRNQLTNYAAQRCGDANTFASEKTAFNDRVGLQNNLVNYHNANHGFALFPGLSALSTNTSLTVDYASSAAVLACRSLIAQTEAKMTTAENFMRTAETNVQSYLNDHSLLQNADTSLTEAGNQFKLAQTNITELKSKGCDIGETAGSVTNLQNRLNSLRQTAMTLQDKVKSISSSYINTTWNGILNAAEQLEGNGNCSQLKLSASPEGLLNIIEKAFCYAIAAVSAALGGFACLLAGQIIDPIFSPTHKPNTTCDAKKAEVGSDGASSSGGSTSTSPASSTSPKTSPSSSPAAGKSSPTTTPTPPKTTPKST